MFGISVRVEIPLDDPLPKGVNFEALHHASHTLAMYAREVWVSAVSGNMLPGMSQPINDAKYAASISVRQAGNGMYTVGTNYAEADRIENGYPSYDMKPGLLASPHARVTKDGQGVYMTVPFRHYTGPSRARVPARHRSIAPPNIVQFLRDTGLRYKGDSTGQQSKTPLLSYGGEPLSGVNYEAVSRGAAPPMQEPYTWVSGPQQGMVRIPIGGGERGKYMTFRRVSTRRQVRSPDGRMVWAGSDPNSWIHPGQPANPISEAVQSYIEPQVMAAAQEILNIGERTASR